MKELNIITILIAAMFSLPILFGAIESFSKERLQYSLDSMFNNVEFLLGLIISINVTKKIFHENTGIYKQIYDAIPNNIKEILYGRDVLTYIFVVPVLLVIALLALRIITTPIYRYILIPASNILFSTINSTSSFLKRIIGGLWQLPKSVYIVFIFGLLLNFYTYYFSSPVLAKWMNESSAYRVLYDNAIYPVLNSNIAKKVPVLINDSFKDIGMVLPSKGVPGEPPISKQIADRFKNSNVRVIEYFNGVTLDEAIKTTPEIDVMAEKIVGNEKNSKKKAQLIYKWVSSNIKYDFDKAVRVSNDPTGISSGSKVAFETKKGICFDYSCLYISMCRAVGVKVRLTTGLGYSGVSWGDHAWNQVYFQEEARWINVDTTFGTAGDYFDKPDFDVDHKYSEVQGEW